MKKWLLCLAVALFAAVSCAKDGVPETDYSSPVSFTTKGGQYANMELLVYYLATEAGKEHAEEDHFFLSASLIPGKRQNLLSHEAVTLAMNIPDISELKDGQEVAPLYVSFGYLATSSTFRMTNKITSGQIVYRGRNNGYAVFEFHDVIFKTSPTEYAPTGEHILSGTMNCPVFDTIDDAFEGLKEMGWI